MSADADDRTGDQAGEDPGLTVVLGWDGLDYDLAGAFDLREAFGPHHARLATFDNPVLGEPHTKELWPSIVTGVEPDEHGIHAATDDGPDWDDPRIATAARLARGVVPDRVRTEIGRLLRNQGATFAQKGPDHYRGAGVPTVFDGRRSRVIAVPNYRTDRDRDTDYVVDRGGQLSDFLSITESSDTNRPETTLPRLQERLVAETTKKLGAVRAALRREHDIVFVWLSVLDTVGHLAPVVADEDPSWQERTYRLAANATRAIREDLQREDTLVCVSDHGLRDGDHTHDAFIGASDERAVEGVESVLDVREGLERVTPTRDEAANGGARRDATRGDADAGGPPVREAYRFGGTGRAKDADEVRGQLEDLGYL
ncbi:alkaline phosphatase family protein [Haloglomus litoreum]|uniref:alkaline phosphatase family protein n=1 Tax=Haloglomus litoreum TaxID=3034026 RepID=UPI0023E7E818|nr:alkaline phosphatase family protein [Haloglomus sp. DT116]